MKIGEWHGRDCPVSEKLLQQREAVVERTYKGPESLEAHVVIVYGRNWRGIHPPPMCLTAIGWRMRREFTLDLGLPAGGKARIRAMVMDRRGETLGGVYLYADREAVSDSWTTLVGRMMDAPQAVRCLLGVYVVDGGRKKTGEALVEVARKLCEALLRYVQRSFASSGAASPHGR
jgi:hypothetical protein